MIKRLWQNERLREIFLYCVVGGLTTLVNYLVYFLFTRLVGGAGAGRPNLAALILDGGFQNVGLAVLGTLAAWVAAVAFAFYPNKRWVFRSRGGDLGREIRQFVSARVLSLIVDVLLMVFFLAVLRMNDMLAKLIVQAFVVIANYFASKFWIFKKREGSKKGT